MKIHYVLLKTEARHKLTSCLVICCLAVALALGSFLFAEAYEIGTTDQFDLDVVFAIDNSGSMNQSDPDKLALTAANLFIDMCEGSDSRVGYVMYTHVIAAQRELTDLISFSRDIKREITSAKYNGDTDIALGIETALDIFENKNDTGTNTRQPVIILLSDGNTDLPKGPRTLAESEAALEQAKADAESKGIPIYTVGFNFDGSLDINTMQSIASTSGGIMRETRSANELPRILRDIYGDLTGASSENMTVIATGAPQSVTISIEDNSNYKTTITVMSSQQVRDISLTMPNGAEPDPDRVTENSDPNGKYTLLSVYKPEKGDWTLTFTGSKDDTVSIDLLSIYDLTLVFGLPRTSAGEAELTWWIEDNDGSSITDQDLLDALSPVIHVSSVTTGEEFTEQFPSGQTTMSITLEPDDYKAYLSIDNHGIVRTSNEQMFSVPDAPPFEGVKDISLTDSMKQNSDTYNVSLMTIFKPRKEIRINDIVNFTRENLPLSILGEAGAWGEYVDFNYDAASELITLSALKTGSTEILVTVSDTYDHSVDFYMSVKLYSGLIPIIAAIVLVLVAAIIVIIILMKKRPYLDDPMGKLFMKMKMPPDVNADPPQVWLKLPHTREKHTLRQLINRNIGIVEPYRIAFEEISWVADGMVFSAKTKSLLEIKIPSNPQYTVRSDGQAGKNLVSLNKNGGAEISIGSGSGSGDNYSEYIITFGEGAPAPSPWGGGGQVPDTWDGGGQVPVPRGGGGFERNNDSDGW